MGEYSHLFQTFPPYPKRPHASGQARISIRKKHVYLGPWGSAGSWAKYRQVMADWRAAVDEGAPGPEVDRESAVVTVADLVAAYLHHVKATYRTTSGEPSTEARDIGHSLRPLMALHGDTLVDDFGPLKLKAVRAAMIDGSWLTPEEAAARAKIGRPCTLCRKTANQRVGRVKRMFRWAVSEELIDVRLADAIDTIAGLRAGRTAAVDHGDVMPADPDAVDAVLPLLGPVVRAMVIVQRYTGMRPGELCALTPADIDQTGGAELAGTGLWVHRPAAHKTAWHGHARAIVFGPRAQAALIPLLSGRAADVPLFSPAEEMAAVTAARLAAAVARGYVRRPRAIVRRPKRVLGTQYTVAAYGQRVAKTCRRAGVTPWTPHQLRHLAEVEIERAFSLDAARAVLGHRDARVTLRYGMQDLATAAKVAAAMG